MSEEKIIVPGAEDRHIHVAEDMAATDTTAREPAMTAFVVVIDSLGNAVAYDDTGVLDGLEIQRSANLADMERAALQIGADLQAAKTAGRVLGFIQMAQQQAMEQAAAQQLLQSVGPNLRG